MVQLWEFLEHSETCYTFEYLYYISRLIKWDLAPFCGRLSGIGGKLSGIGGKLSGIGGKLSLYIYHPPFDPMHRLFLL
ncbi:MAG: hypothetical protein WB988_26555 [Candidatus Nitrosopolaris sp.]